MTRATCSRPTAVCSRRSSDPHNVNRTLIQMGVLYEAMDRPDRALVLYETALAREPSREDLPPADQPAPGQGGEIPVTG